MPPPPFRQGVKTLRYVLITGCRCQWAAHNGQSSHGCLMSHAGPTSETDTVRDVPGSPPSRRTVVSQGAYRVAAFSRRRALMIGLLAIGAALRLWQYAADTSFWRDEVALAHNIVEHPLRRLLLESLAGDQVAPKGFLLVQKLAVMVLGPSELAMRLFPLLCGLAAFVLFWRLAERVLGGRAALVAVALFAFGIPFIRYAAEAKQYGVDIAATVTLMLLAVGLIERQPTVRRCVASGLAGIVIVSFSQAAVLVMAGLGAVLAARWLVGRDRRMLRPVVITVPLWAAASLAALVVARHSMTPETQAYMYSYWRGSFLPWPPHPRPSLFWIWNRVRPVFGGSWMLRYPWAELYVMVMLVGFVALWGRRRRMVLVSLAPLAVTLLAASAHQYPFANRLILFLVPGVMLGIAAGIDWLAGASARWHRGLGAAVVTALLLPPAYAIVSTPPPYHVEKSKPVLEYLQTHRRPGDAVFVFFGGRWPAMYYGPRYGLRQGEWVLGVCDRNDIRAYLRDIDRFRGTPRLWVLILHVATGPQPRRAVERYLAAIGIRREGITTATPFHNPVSVALYDLSDSTRLRSASAETFPVEAFIGRRLNCGRGGGPTTG
jgi:4-amino-4-deoxy-L-arabinose transferase-like glycosyltransferase